MTAVTNGATIHDMTTTADQDLYDALDHLHGQVLRAKYRLRENPDRDKLADLIADVVWCAKKAESEWQTYEASQA